MKKTQVRPLTAQPSEDAQVTLAKYFFGLDIGSRIINVRGISAALNMSVGAVSNLMNGLQESGAISVEKRGHMGSYITGRSITKLWNIVGKGPMVIAMSLPMHVRFEGLATAIKKSLESAGIETYMTFIRGSRNRLQAVNDDRCHAAVMSLLSASDIPAGKNGILYTLPPGSWLSGYRVFYRKPSGDMERPLRVAVDHQSADHNKLTEIEFQDQNVELVPVSYVQTVRMLKKGEVDAIVWNEEQMDELESRDIYSRPLSDRTIALIGEQRPLCAAFVGKSAPEGVGVKRVLEEYVTAENVERIQQQVVTGEIFPYY